jgi:hypothetical protein
MISDSTIIKIAIDYHQPSLIIEVNWYIIVGLFLVVASYYFFKPRFFKKLNGLFGDEVEIEINTGLIKYKRKIRRNYQNLFIANRIYIELVTRKAALPIDKEKDVIVEIYDSWQILFKTIREEIKNLPGEYLVGNQETRELINLSIRILNEGLRPHLTSYQAEFRKWYAHESKQPINNKRTPQDIQKRFPKYNALLESILDVNNTLMAYCDQLKGFIERRT